VAANDGMGHWRDATDPHAPAGHLRYEWSCGGRHRSNTGYITRDSLDRKLQVARDANAPEIVLP
jgi:hypothetical protein